MKAKTVNRFKRNKRVSWVKPVVLIVCVIGVAGISAFATWLLIKPAAAIAAFSLIQTHVITCLKYHLEKVIEVIVIFALAFAKFALELRRE